MLLRNKIEELLKQIKALEQNPQESQKLPQGAYYLNERDILCTARKNGESRYPYDSDGLNVWARSSGYIEAQESTFTVFNPVYFQADPSVAFFAGLPMENGKFMPISVLGVAKQMFEPESIKRYVVYGFRCAYYITETENLTLAVRLHNDANKHIHFAFVAINHSDKEQKFYLESNIEAALKFNEPEGFWDKMLKYGRLYENGNYIIRALENCMNINLAFKGGNVTQHYSTVSKNQLLGEPGRTLQSAISLVNGKFDEQITSVNNTDTPVAADIVHYTLHAGEYIRQEYELSYCFNHNEAMSKVGNKVDTAAIDAELARAEEAELASFATMKIKFDNYTGNLNHEVLNRFLVNVQKQVSICALGKNYAGEYIGMRDVMQQLESSLIWNPKASRAKLLVALNYVLEEGRAPRQFSVPPKASVLPKMDLHHYIDQGLWIISTVYAYLAHTNDFSILNEKVGYYVPNAENTAVVAKSEIEDTVLDHLLKITEYVASNLDTEEGGTNCLCALYGDWNDAVDSLGKTNRPGRMFGNGVSVMASLQFWQNLREMSEILTKLGVHLDKVPKYEKLAESLKEGLLKYAIDVNENGERKILQGWGDMRSYKICSFNDPDGKERTSATSHSFWAICGMLYNDLSVKDVIKTAADKLDGKYGILTFENPFTMELHSKVGRICTITPGIYENATSYVHSSLFFVAALLIMGESKRAWREYEKSIVISHDNCSLTPFVMPNSYFLNPEYNIDGESGGDWYTGSGTVVIKNMVKYGFGLRPTLDGLVIQTATEMPTTKASLDVVVKGKAITVKYTNNGNGERVYKLNGKVLEACEDAVSGGLKAFIANEDIENGAIIEVEN